MQKLIDEETGKHLKKKFDESMKDEVDVKIFTNKIISPGDNQSAEILEFTRQLGNELSEIEPRIKVEEKPISDKAAKEMGLTTSPSILIGYGKGYKIVYNGAPLGHEATGFIETIMMVSSGNSGLEKDQEKLVASMDKDVSIRVFVTPSCPYCPKSVITANKIAVASKGKVVSECVEAAENRELSEEFNVGSVPQQVINDDHSSTTVGAQPDEQMVMQVFKYGSPEKYEKLAAEMEKEKKQREVLADNPDKTVYITDGNIEEALAKYENLVIDFWAEWCMPCKMIGPVIEELAAEYKEKLVFGKLNVDENKKSASRHGVMSIPALMLFKKGKKEGEIIGAQPKQEMEANLKKVFNL